MQEPSSPRQQLKEHGIDYLTPFAKITLVEAESPAYQAGLRVGDLLSEFAEISIYTIEHIKQIPRYVKEGAPITLVVLRVTEQPPDGRQIFSLKDGNNYQKLSYVVTPGKWAGKGLLGCRFDRLH